MLLTVVRANRAQENFMYAYAPARIDKQRKPEVDVCGICGCEVDSTRYICSECEHLDSPANEPIKRLEDGDNESYV